MSCRHVVVVLFIANHRWPLNRSPLRRFSPLRFPACTAPLKGFADTQGLTKGLPAHTKGLPRACWHTRRAYQGLAGTHEGLTKGLPDTHGDTLKGDRPTPKGFRLFYRVKFAQEAPTPRRMAHHAS